MLATSFTTQFSQTTKFLRAISLLTLLSKLKDELHSGSPSLSAGRVESLTKFSKKLDLAGSQFLEGVC